MLKRRPVRAACAYHGGTRAIWQLGARRGVPQHGPDRVAKALESQHVATYWDLPPDSETARYVYRMLALREVMESPEMYAGGFHLGRQDVYAPLDCRTVNVSSDIDDLAEFALVPGHDASDVEGHEPLGRDTHLDVPEGKILRRRCPPENPQRGWLRF